MSGNPSQHQPRKGRQNVILALVHVVLVLVILAGFIYVQTRA